MNDNNDNNCEICRKNPKHSYVSINTGEKVNLSVCKDCAWKKIAEELFGREEVLEVEIIQPILVHEL